MKKLISELANDFKTLNNKEMKTIKYNFTRNMLLPLLLPLLLSSMAFSQITVGSGYQFVNKGNLVLKDLGITNNGTFTDAAGTITFTGIANSTIGGTGTSTTFNNITINKSTNTVGLVLNNNVTLNGTLTLTTGDFDVYNKTLTLGSLAAITGESNDNWLKSTASTSKGTITTTRNLTGSITGYTFGNIGVSVTTSSILGSTVITRSFTPITIGSNTGIAKAFTITPTNNTDLNATYVFNYFGNEVSGFDPANMVVFLSTNGGANFVQSTAVNNWNSGTQAGTLTMSNLASFGANNVWTSSDNNHPLPVTLAAFTSSVNSRDVKLQWTTSTENNNVGFEIQRAGNSQQGIGTYEKITFINGKGTINTPTNYTFTDTKLNSGKYNYRIKQIDNNGNYAYFDLANAVEVALPTKYNMSQNYPNPFNPTTKIDFEIPENTFVKIVMFDILGREVKSIMKENKQAGFYTAILNTNDLSSGTYFYRMEAGKYIKTLKMTIIK
ncbi:MAG: T9SS type A sorting domain-containing protein [Paludibacter sp.]